MVYRIFTQILNMSITASVVIVAVLLIRGVMHRLPKKYLYMLWVIVGIRLVCPAAISSPVSLFNVIGQSAEKNLAVSMESWAGKADAAKTGGSRLAGNMLSSHTVSMQPQLESNISAQGGKNASDGILVPGEDSLAVNSRVKQINPFVRYGVIVWLAGIVVILLWNLYITFRMKQKLEKAVRYQGNIYECDNIPSPFVMGMIRPRIYIPFRLGEEEREYILKHEQYHIKRRDYIVKLAAFLLTCVYWFHPLVWLSYLLMIRDMEMSCDEYVLQNMPADIRKSYSKSLLGFAANQRGMAVGLLAFGETDTRKRVKNVLNFKNHGKWISVLAIIILVIAGTVCLTNAQDSKKQSGKDSQNEDSQINDNQNKNSQSEDSQNKDSQDKDTQNKDTQNKNTEDKKGADKQKSDEENDEKKTVDEDGRYTAVLAEGLAHGYRVQIVYLSDSELPEKADLDFGMYKGSGVLQEGIYHGPAMFELYKGAFAIQTYKGDSKCAEYPLQLAETMYFPANGFDLVLKDYDSDGAADDFSLGQGQTPDPRFGNFMVYHFFGINEDGSITQHNLSTKDGQSLTTIPGDFSKEFEYKYKHGWLVYIGLGEDGTKEKTARIVRTIAKAEDDNAFIFRDLNATIRLPGNTKWIKNPAASVEGKVGIIIYHDEIAQTDVTLRFGKTGQKSISDFSVGKSAKADEYWSYGNEQRLIQVKFYPMKNSITTAVLYWKYKGMEFYLYADFPDKVSSRRNVDSNWPVLAKTAAYIAEEFRLESK